MVTHRSTGTEQHLILSQSLNSTALRAILITIPTDHQVSLARFGSVLQKKGANRLDMLVALVDYLYDNSLCTQLQFYQKYILA